MFDLLKTYLCYEVGFAVGKRLPGAVRAIGKGFALLLSCIIWVSIAGGDVFTFSLGMGIRMLAILYCIFVWGGMIGLIVLKVKKDRDWFKIYHWILLGFSLLMGVLAMEEKSFGYILLGLIVGFFLKQFPEFIYILVDAAVKKFLQMKGNK